MDKLVDFSQPIEAKTHIGETVYAEVIRTDGASAYVHIDGYTPGQPDPHPGLWYNASGKCMGVSEQYASAPTLRNRAAAKPSTPSNEELTQRMEKLVRAIVAQDDKNRANGDFADYEPGPIFNEARAILADLPKPVDPIDPDLVLARRVVADEYERGNMPGLAVRALAGEMDGRMRVRAARSAIKLGRTLAAGGTAHE